MATKRQTKGNGGDDSKPAVREKPSTKVVVKVFANHTEVDIEGFDGLSPGKLNKRVVANIFKEYHRRRRELWYKHRRAEAAKQKEEANG